MTGVLPRHRIVVVLGIHPVIDIHAVAARAMREGRPLTVVRLGRRMSAEQNAIISELAHLSFSWFECLSYEVVAAPEHIWEDDEVIVAGTSRERRTFESNVHSVSRPIVAGIPNADRAGGKRSASN